MGLLEMRSLEVNSLTSQVYSLFRDPGMHLSGLQGRIKNNPVDLLRIFKNNFPRIRWIDDRGTSESVSDTLRPWCRDASSDVFTVSGTFTFALIVLR